MIARGFRQFAKLTPADRWLLIRSVVLVAAARLALWALPFNAARRMLTRGALRRSGASPATAEKIGWAVSVAQRFVPMGNCLPQALAAESLLLRNGHPVEFRIGVMKTAEDRLQAHAWVESCGYCVVGDLMDGMSAYSPLPPLPVAKV